MASLSFIRTLTAAAAAALVLTGCGTPDPPEPTELQSIHEVVKTDKEWTASVGESLTGLLAPAVTEDTVYAAGGDELYAFELATGRRLWKTDVGSDVTAGVGTDGSLIAVGTASGDLKVYDTAGKLPSSGGNLPSNRYLTRHFYSCNCRVRMEC